MAFLFWDRGSIKKLGFKIKVISYAFKPILCQKKKSKARASADRKEFTRYFHRKFTNPACVLETEKRRTSSGNEGMCRFSISSCVCF